ncbi:MAG: DegQ family serine endoprotease [Pseudomonadota bacterium]
MISRLIALVLALALGGAASAQQQERQAATPPVQPPPAAARDVPADFTELARPLLPAVVNVSTERTISQPGIPGIPGIPGLPPPFGPPPGREAPDQPPRRGTALGSGFIIDPSGVVVTNAHVVEDARQVTIILHDERRLEAKVLGTDERTDIAVLKVETSTPLPHVAWGESDTVEVGEWVLAIGNPFGLGGTVTSGIISATARNIGAGPYDAFLQTDAPINQGNSGGPMFNMQGQVIGINTAIFSPTGGNIGIGFAIPASIARPVVEQLRATGTVRRGWLGVQIQTVNPDIAQALGLDKPQGALVADVLAGSPAAEVGLKVGDVILAYNGQALDEAHRLPRLVAETKIGSPAQLTVLRDGKRIQVDVKIAELKDEVDQAKAGETGELGLALGQLTDALRAKLGLPQGTTGAVVQGVKPGSPAAERGFRPGDVITMVAQRPVKGPEDVARMVGEARKAGRTSVLMLTRRGERQTFVTLPLPKGK